MRVVGLRATRQVRRDCKRCYDLCDGRGERGLDAALDLAQRDDAAAGHAAGGETTTEVWDGETRTWTLTSAEGRVLEVEVDVQGRAVSVRPSGLAETTLEYDAEGRLRRASRTAGAEVRELSLGYEGAARWASSVTDGAMAEASVTHDGLGRPTTLTEPSRNDATLGYEDATREVSVTGFGSAAGTHALSYDPAGRLASYTPPAVSGASEGATGYVYDADGVLRTLTLPDGASVAVTTDSAGRPASLALAAGTLTLGYDGTTGQLERMRMPNTAGEQGLALSYDGPLLTQQRFTGPATTDVDVAYDDALRVSSLTVAGEVTDYAYDRDGLVTCAGAETLTREPDSGVVMATTAGSVRQLFAVSGLLELNQHSAIWSGGGRFNETIDARDGVGRILDATETTGAGTLARGYTYDDDGRVTEERRDGVRVASYVYDAQGNRTQLQRYNATTGAETESRTATYDARDRLLDDGIASYTYDDAGRRATKTAGADVTRYAYDELAHLTRVELPTGVTVEYTYDALGRRTGRTTDGAVDDATDTAWVYGSGPAPIAKLDGLGTLHVAYVYGTRSWVPDLVIVPDAAGVRAQLALITDHRGSVRTMVETRTNATIGDIDYDAFGRPTSPPPAILSYYGFTFAGGTLDADTALIHLGARDYDPETGTWIEPDPIRFGGGDTNLYAYVGGDPVNFVDPSGRQISGPGSGLGAWGMFSTLLAAAASAYAASMPAVQLSRIHPPADTPSHGDTPSCHVDTAQDAFRHCVWSCQVGGNNAWMSAVAATDLHEIEAHGRASARSMDRANNMVGASIGARLSRVGGVGSVDMNACASACDESLAHGYLVVIRDWGTPAPVSYGIWDPRYWLL